MTIRRFFPVLCLVLLQPVVSIAQSSEEDDNETLRASKSGQASAASPELSKVSKQIILQTNGFRDEKGMAAVEPNKKLQETAQYFADFMARTDNYGHTADGQRPAQRAKEHGYDFCLVSENIAYQYNSSGFKADELCDAFLEGWKNSPGHRKNMLQAAATETGVAVARRKETGHYYAVQMFGRPKSMVIEFSIRNDAAATVTYRIGERSFPLPTGYTRTHQRCQPADVSFLEPKGEGKFEVVHAGSGDNFVVSKGPQGLQATKE